MSNPNFNVRGTLFAPQGKSQINYYLCVMDVPEGISTENFVQPTPQQPNSFDSNYDPNACFYKCNIDLGSFVNQEPTKTIALPMYTYTPYAPKNSIIIEDLAGNLYKGNPNQGRPPRFELDANPESDYTTTNLIVQSDYFTDNYFVVVIASSKNTSEDVSNYFLSMIPDGSNLVCTLQTSGGASNFQAPIGAYGCRMNDILSTQVAGGNTPTPVDWSGDIHHL